MKKIAPIFFAAALLLTASCERGRYEVITGYAQGGTYAVKYDASQAGRDRKTVQHAVDSLLLLIDNTLSGYNRSSLVSRINRGEEAVPNPMLKDIYSISYRICIFYGKLEPAGERSKCINDITGKLFKDLYENCKEESH